MMECNIRVALLGQRYHPFGNIHSFDLKSVCNQPIDEAATAAAADIQCILARCGKLDGAVELRNADRLHLRILPTLRDSVVTLTYFVWAHSVTYVTRPGRRRPC